MTEYGYLAHHGIKGQKWGVRRYQNADGSYTAAGRERYGVVRKTRNFIGTKSGHYGRNKHNTDLPTNDIDALDQGWTKLSKKQSAFHQFNTHGGVDNSKWLSPDGKKEVVFTGKGKRQRITKDARDEGTYNYFDPIMHPVLHAVADVTPYMILGNSVKDTTTPYSRTKKALQVLREKQK